MSSGSCGKTEFRCRISRQCIFLRFLCDGVADCADGSDEAGTRCGINPCLGKIRCLNNRCIPAETCCNPRTDPTCDKWKRSECCDFPHFPGRTSDYPFEKKYRPPNLGTNDASYNPNWGLQSAVFVIAGCSLAFIALILLLSFFLAKYLVKRISRRSQRTRADHRGEDSHDPGPHGSSCHHDLFCPNSRLLIQYNINHGIQIYRPPGPDGALPPPYTERPLLPPDDPQAAPYGPPSETGAAPPAYSDIVFGENGEISRRPSLKSDIIRARQDSGSSDVSRATMPYDYTLPRHQGMLDQQRD